MPVVTSEREPLVIAHRGSSAAVAEHTVGAYRQAITEGADGLECDVRLSADGELVCLHDRTLERTGGSTGIVSSIMAPAGRLSIMMRRSICRGAFSDCAEAAEEQ